MNQNIANWFEIPVKNLEKAKTFYEHVFNIEMQLNEMGPLTMAWFPMVEDAPFATGTLINGPGYSPSHFLLSDLLFAGLPHPFPSWEKNRGSQNSREGIIHDPPRFHQGQRRQNWSMVEQNS